MIQWAQNRSCFRSGLRQVWGDSPSFGKINGQVSPLPALDVSRCTMRGERLQKKKEEKRELCSVFLIAAAGFGFAV